MRSLLLVVPCLIAAPAAAQRLVPHAAVWLAEHRIDVGAEVEVTSGPVIGAGITSRFAGRWLASVELVGGTLAASGDGFDRDFAQLRVAAGYQLTPWLSLTAGYLTRTYTAPLGRQRWKLSFGEASVRLPFAVAGLAGVGRMAFAPAVSVTELASPGPTIITSAGIEYDVARFGFALSYGVERHTFEPQSGSIRNEQLSALMLRLAWRPSL